MNAHMGVEAAARRYVVFAVADRRLAVSIEQVARVIHAVEITPLPAATLLAAAPTVAGFVDLHGDLVPVVDMRRRLGLAERELELTDHFVLVQRDSGRWFLACDGVVGVVELSDGSLSARDRLDRGSDCCSADLYLDEGTVSVLDLERLVSAKEANRVRSLLSGGAAR